MLYSKEIDDNAKIQLIILFTLSNAGRPVRYDDLINIIFENCNINFAEFQIALSHLEEIKHIGKTLDDSGCDIFFLLPEGKASNEYLEDTIPVYIRNPIKKFIRPYFKEEEEKSKIIGEAICLGNDEYTAHIAVMDSDDLPLLDMNFYTGARDEALKIVKKFKSDPENMYKKILEILCYNTEGDVKK